MCTGKRYFNSILFFSIYGLYGSSRFPRDPFVLEISVGKKSGMPVYHSITCWKRTNCGHVINTLHATQDMARRPANHNAAVRHLLHIFW